MENFCKHAEDHLNVLDIMGEAEDVEGKASLTCSRRYLSVCILFKPNTSKQLEVSITGFSYLFYRTLHLKYGDGSFDDATCFMTVLLSICFICSDLG